MDKFISQKFGESEVLFSVENINTSGIIRSAKEFPTVTSKKGLKAKETSVSEKVADGLHNIRDEIKSLIVGFGGDIHGIKDKMKAQSVEMEFSLSFSAEGKLIVGVKAEGSIGIKIKWENK